MATWGGDRGRGRPAEFETMKRILVQFEEDELIRLKELADYYNSMEETQISVSKILRQLALDWMEEQEKKRRENIDRIIREA